MAKDTLEREKGVAIIGGGPGGVGCALTLKRLARDRDQDIRVVIYEGKRFGEHYNQCAGVLSHPLEEILERDFGLKIPRAMIQRVIKGYVLYGEKEEIVLEEDPTKPSLAVQRVELDRFLLNEAVKRGVEVIQSRVTDVEFHPHEVVVYSWSGTCRTSAVVGAFGLSKAMTACFSRRVGYAPPPHLETLVTKFYPPPSWLPNLLENMIHVFLPPFPRTEFGALIPKGDHITIILAGWNITTNEMEAFLSLPKVKRLLPPKEHSDFFKGRFPTGLAKRFYGHRYLLVGDASGLVRPFKGKGINTAVITGRSAAITLMNHGPSQEASLHYRDMCKDLMEDMIYGRLARTLASLTRRYSSLDPIIREAKRNESLKEALFFCVSGHAPYRKILRNKAHLRALPRLLPHLLGSFHLSRQ